MKKKRLLQVPPIQPRDCEKRYYRAAADVIELAGESHLILDIYERECDGKKYIHVYRFAYTAGGWGVYDAMTGAWGQMSIRNNYETPMYDKCGMVAGPGIPRYPSWKNTAIDKESIEKIKSFSEQFDTGYNTVNWYDWLLSLELGIKHEKERKALASRKEKLLQRIADMPEIPKDFDEWADDHLYHNQEFVYYRRKGRWADCTCSKCGAQYRILTKRSESFEGQFEDVHPVPQNDTQTQCLHCGAIATYKPIGRCRGILGMIHQAYLIQPFRGDGTVVRYFNVHKEWSKTSPSRVYKIELARTFFETGKKEKIDWQLHSWYTGKDEWHDHNIDGIRNLSMKPGGIYMENASEWAACRAVRYSGLKEYVERDGGCRRPVWYLNVAERYPLEKLVKMGLIRLADDVIEYESYRKDKALKAPLANRADRLLGIRPCRLSMLRQREGEIRLLRILQAEKNNTEKVMDGLLVGKGAWTEEQIEKLYNLGIDKGDLEMVLDYMSVTKFINRVEKYCKGPIPDKITGWGCMAQETYYGETVRLYLDYIRMRVENGYGMERSTDQAPKDLEKAHRDIVQAINAAENERRLEESEKTFSKIKKRYRVLKRQYAWKHDDLMIRPAKSVREIIEEGQFLHHCVGRGDYYIRKHNDGESFILFIRYANNPNEPYITLEVDPAKNKILQWYGRNDTKPNEARIEEWLGEWLAEVKERKAQEALSAAKAQANQEAAAEQVLIAAV